MAGHPSTPKRGPDPPPPAGRVDQAGARFTQGLPAHRHRLHTTPRPVHPSRAPGQPHLPHPTDDIHRRPEPSHRPDSLTRGRSDEDDTGARGDVEHYGQQDRADCPGTGPTPAVTQSPGHQCPGDKQHPQPTQPPPTTTTTTATSHPDPRAPPPLHPTTGRARIPPPNNRTRRSQPPPTPNLRPARSRGRGILASSITRHRGRNGHQPSPTTTQ